MQNSGTVGGVIIHISANFYIMPGGKVGSPKGKGHGTCEFMGSCKPTETRA